MRGFLALSRRTLSISLTILLSHSVLHAGPSSSLQQCPSGQGFRSLTNLHPVHTVVVGYVNRGGSIDLTKAIAEWVVTQSPPRHLVVYVPHKSEKEAEQDLQFLSDPLYKNSVSIRFMNGDARPTMWMQDLMEIGVFGKESRPAILGLPAIDMAEGVPEDFATHMNAHFIPHEKVPFKFEADGSSGGGNIEAYPGGIVALGDTADPFVMRFLQKNSGTPIVKVDMGWHKGHIDEVVSLVPSQNSCGFSLLRASPKVAFDLAAQTAAEGRDLILETPPLEERKSRPTTTDSEHCALGITNGRGLLPLKHSEFQKCDEIVSLNHTYEKSSETTAKKLALEISKRTGCKNVEIIPLPVLFKPSLPDDESGDGVGFPHALNANPINSLVLEDTIIIPRQPNIVYGEYIQNKLSAAGVRPVFVNADTYHHWGGHAHCGTNVLRTCSGQK